MAYTRFLTSNARKDIQQAIDWEDERKLGLGKKFLLDLEKRISEIASTPKIGSIRYESVRCTTTKLFQYLVHYTVDTRMQNIIILRVIHTSRMPLW